MKHFRLFLVAATLLSHLPNGISQNSSERLLETHWRYTYTLHLETNSVAQQANDKWQQFLWFRFDSVCRQSLNGKTSDAPWRLDGQQIHFAFRQKNTFSVARLNDFSLELDFNDPSGKGTYRYHFVRIKGAESPLSAQSNTLPVVQIQTIQQVEGAESAAVAPIANLPAPAGEDICIELVGGGYYDGVHKAQHNYVTISKEGRLISELESLRGEKTTRKVSIPKTELEQFITWAATEQRFFEFENTYDCKTPECEKRKTVKPAPVPLRLSITQNGKRKMISIGIWGLDKNGRRYVSYPPELDRVIDAIQRMANREEKTR